MESRCGWNGWTSSPRDYYDDLLDRELTALWWGNDTLVEGVGHRDGDGDYYYDAFCHLDGDGCDDDDVHCDRYENVVDSQDDGMRQ